jgi:hypothetical protein
VTGDFDASVVVGALAGAVVVEVLVAGGSLAGVLVVGVGVVVGVVVPDVVVVPVGVVLVVVVCVGVSEAGVVEVPDGGEELGEGSLASAPPVKGPPSPTAVMPPPASTETITRRTLKGAPCRADRSSALKGTPHRGRQAGALERAPFTSDMLGPCSSLCGPVVAVEQSAARGRRPPDPIHIGREPHLGKGFVIGAVT